MVTQAGSTPDTRGEVLAIVPARGGSKSIPHKNIKLLDGFPLIAYSIAIARQAPSVSRVIVSTDDEEIAQVAREWGAETPFQRPEEISRDETTDLPVFQHALQWLQEHEKYVPGIVIQLRPTSPFRRLSHIEDSIRLLHENQNADSVRTVCTPFQNPFKMWMIDSNSFLKPLISSLGDEPYNQPRQSLPSVFWQTGYVDAVRPHIIQNGSMSGINILPLVIDDGDWIDIDSPADWQMAENLMQSKRIKTEDLGFSMSGVLPT